MILCLHHKLFSCIEGNAKHCVDCGAVHQKSDSCSEDVAAYICQIKLLMMAHEMSRMDT